MIDVAIAAVAIADAGAADRCAGFPVHPMLNLK
jgi:hypothetical protein